MSVVFDLTIVNILCHSMEATRRATQKTHLRDCEVLGLSTALSVRRLARWRDFDMLLSRRWLRAHRRACRITSLNHVP